MLSKFAGTCACCSKSIAKGELIAWSKRGGAQHAKCAGVYVPVAPQDVRAACWICGDAEGKFRQRGAATPVWCDACNAKEAQKEADYRKPRERFVPDAFDLAYEDRCAEACGLL